MHDLKLAVIGVDHRHIYGQLEGMLALGCMCKGWWTEGDPQPVDGFVKRFPDVPRVADRSVLLNDPEIDLVLIADIPARRAERAIEAMRAGKDVMTDKPGCTTMEQLEDIRRTVSQTGRIWSIDFSERFEVPAVSKAAELVNAGAVGTVVQTVGLGPHRLNRATRPDWFFDDRQYGGILCDIASHQIDQFLFFTGSSDAEIVSAGIGNFANQQDPGLQDFGEILLRSDKGQGYIRVDWYTPDGLPTWGDGRLTILGTEGYIELRKYVDVAGRPGTDHLVLVNGERCEHIDASGAPLPYFENLASDVRNRTETAMGQSHCFKVMELAIRAQAAATRLGHLRDTA
ncbi:Gfo/Idh/MocA family protein [Hoeflea poritis]|uniref:Gfo/Idh/MocA family oxidoreductase n=1 Tax=Hoeflea poritis TaxID=2993659 RepID=A0ABT4VRZ2_9HYPH|nr:Gfo/Idh/MocA family oxidoreductase [Hoeflea poritis]MDA4847488.1 Gfo/Idh/MocA family oxidoreductase [Hoeflea poritis]